MRDSILIAVLLWLVQIIVIVVLVNQQWAQSVVHREEYLAQQWLGVDSFQEIQRWTDQAYYRMFVHTGLYDGSYYLFLPNEEQARRDQDFQVVGEKVLPYLVERLNIFWTMLYQTVMRLVTIGIWWPFLLVSLLPSILDGWVRRRIKISNMGYTSPVRNRYALWSMLAVLYLFLVIAFWPWPVNPVIYPVLIALFALSLSLFISNMQKRI